MIKERDYQKFRLYKAEHVLEDMSQRLETTQEMAAFLTKVMNSAPIQRRYAPYLRSTLTVSDGRGRRRACGGYGRIRMPKWARTTYIVLHETAHTLTIRKYGEGTSAHGREYAAIYLDLVRFGMGKEAHAALLASFKAHKVKYRAPKRRAKPIFTQRIKFQAAAKIMPKRAVDPMRQQNQRAYRDLRKVAREWGFTFKLSGDGYLETSDFPHTGMRFATLHYDWHESLRRVKLCIADPLLIDGDGYYSE
jgi:putative metallohydrolase (TIGR04338 family)